MRIAVGAIVFALIFGALGIAQEDKTPTLTKEQDQAIELLFRRLQVDDLQIKNAQLDAALTSKELTTMIQDLQKPGYTFDVEKRIYTKKTEPIKK